MVRPLLQYRASTKLDTLQANEPESQIRQYDDLVIQVEDLAIQSDAERSAAEESIRKVSQEFADGVERLSTAIDQLEDMFDTDKEGYNLSQGKLSKPRTWHR